MTPQEVLVLVAAATLVELVFMQPARGALTSRAALLWTLAALASIAALLHMFAR